MRMRALAMNGITIPVPENWRIPPNSESHVGEEGLLDVRAHASGVPIDQERLSFVREKLSSCGAMVELLIVQDVNCLHCSYKEDDCTVVTYSFEAAAGSEVTAVYAFRPEYEALAKQVREAIIHPDGLF